MYKQITRKKDKKTSTRSNVSRGFYPARGIGNHIQLARQPEYKTYNDSTTHTLYYIKGAIIFNKMAVPAKNTFYFIFCFNLKIILSYITLPKIYNHITSFTKRNIFSFGGIN